MKSHSICTASVFRLALCGSVALLTQSIFSQSWQTVLDFQYVAGYRSWNEGLVVAPSGTVFASGFADIGTNRLEVVVASQDGGTTWFGPLDEYVAGLNAPVYGGAPITSDANGTLYVAVQTSYSGPEQWVVRQGTDGGTNWATVDDCTFVGSRSGSPYPPNGITADAAGNVYVAGLVSYTNGTYAWTVRKGAGGTSFSTVDSFAPGGNASAQAVFAHPTAGVFAAGDGSVTVKRSTSLAWIVRRSLDSGATWTTVDTFQLSSGYFAQAKGIGADAQGYIYVVGQANVPYKSENYGHWVVRKSADGGNTWATVDNFQPSATVGSTATRFVADRNGNLFVAGQAPQSSTWLVRENPGGTGVWTTVDSFQYVAGSVSEPQAMAADAFGNVFVGGWADGPSTSAAPHWLVRKN